MDVHVRSWPSSTARGIQFLKLCITVYEIDLVDDPQNSSKMK